MWFEHVSNWFLWRFKLYKYTLRTNAPIRIGRIHWFGPIAIRYDFEIKKFAHFKCAGIVETAIVFHMWTICLQDENSTWFDMIKCNYYYLYCVQLCTLYQLLALQLVSLLNFAILFLFWKKKKTKKKIIFHYTYSIIHSSMVANLHKHTHLPAVFIPSSIHIVCNTGCGCTCVYTTICLHSRTCYIVESSCTCPYIYIYSYVGIIYTVYI